MYFNIKCIGKLTGPTNEFERSLVFETGEFERPKFDCISRIFSILHKITFKMFIFLEFRAILCHLSDKGEVFR